MRRFGLFLAGLSTACLFLGACKSEGGSSSRVRPFAELPPEYATLWRAWAEADPAWLELRAEALADPGLRDFLVENLVLTLLRSFRSSSFATTESLVTGPFERSRRELITLGEYSAPALCELLPLGSGGAATLARELLIEIGQPALEPLLAQLAREDSPQARRRAADALRDMPYAHSKEGRVREALMIRLADDEEWLVRKTAALALGQRGSRDREVATARNALSRALGDPDDEVSRAAAAGLAWLEDPAAIPALINYLQRAIREAKYPNLRISQEVLARLSGVDQALDPAGWRSWWRTNRPPTKGHAVPVPPDGADR